MGKRKTELKPTRKGKSKKAKDGEVKGQGARKRERKGERKGQKDGKGAPFTLDLVYARTFTGVARIERRRRSIAPGAPPCVLSAFSLSLWVPLSYAFPCITAKPFKRLANPVLHSRLTAILMNGLKCESPEK